MTSNKIEQAHKILHKAMQYKPSQIIALTSWGHDSQVSTDIAYRWSKSHGHSTNFVAVTLDTGINADGYVAWCKTQAKTRYPRYEVWSNPDVGFDWYIQNAIEHGFQYTRYGHTNFYYRMLKERTIRLVKAHYKKYHMDKLMFVGGIWRGESSARSSVPAIQIEGAEVWVNPCIHWQKQDFIRYRANHDLPNNPFYDTVGGSGDCQCNWGQFIDLPTLQRHSPQLASKIAEHNDTIIETHGWGWGERPSKGLLQEREGQLPMFEPLINLCAGCQRVKPKHNEALDEMAMREVEW